MPLRALRLAAASLPLVAALTVVGAGTRVGPAGGDCALASSAHHAALVVEHANGSPVARVCVSFSGAEVTGEQLLDLSRVQYNTVDYGSYGKAVCQIQGEPATYPSTCWTASSPYWAMFVSRGGGAWQTSSLGISSQTFGDGDAEGFRYEAQSDSSSPPSPAGTCPAPAPATAPPAAVTARPSPAHPSSSSPAARTSTPASPAVASVSGTPAAIGPASPTAIVGAVAGLSSGGTTPPPRAGSMSAAAWAALALGVALLGVLAVRLRRSRRGGGASRVTQ